MNEPVMLREAIAQEADMAAQRFVLSGVEQDCHYVSGTEVHREWRECYANFVTLYRAAAEVGA